MELLTNFDVYHYMPALLSFLSSVGITTWLVKRWLASRIDHAFKEKIEIFKSQLRKDEKILISKIEQNYKEIGIIKNLALTGASFRQNELYKKRIDAAECMAAHIAMLGRDKFRAKLLRNLNLEVFYNDPNADKFKKTISGLVEVKVDDYSEDLKNVYGYRPFYTPGVWAYFQTYKSILGMATAMAMAIDSGVEFRLLKTDKMGDLLKKIYPTIIEDDFNGFNVNASFYYINMIEGLVFQEIEKMLSGETQDKASIKLAFEISNSADSLISSNNTKSV